MYRDAADKATGITSAPLKNQPLRFFPSAADAQGQETPFQSK